MEILTILSILAGLTVLTLLIARCFFSGAPTDEELERRLRDWNNREKHDI